MLPWAGFNLSGHGQGIGNQLPFLGPAPYLLALILQLPPPDANEDAPTAPAGSCEASGAREPSVPVESWEPVFTNWAGLLRAAAYSVSQRWVMVVSTVRHEQGGP